MNEGKRFTDEFKQVAVAQVVELVQSHSMSALPSSGAKVCVSREGLIRDDLFWIFYILHYKHLNIRCCDDRLNAPPHTSCENLSKVSVYRGSSARVFGAFHVPDVDGTFQRFLRMAKETAKLSWA